MEPSTVDKLLYRVNLHTIAKTPSRPTRAARKLPQSKQADFLSQYQDMILQEKEFISSNKYAQEGGGGRRRAPTSLMSTSLIESDLDPVQDNFIRALRQKLDTYLNKAPGLKEPEKRKERSRTKRWQPLMMSANGSPALREGKKDGSSLHSPQRAPAPSHLPVLANKRPMVFAVHRKPKPSLLDVFRNQLIRNACKTTHEKARSLFGTIEACTPEPASDEISALCTTFKHSLELERSQSPSQHLDRRILDIKGPTVQPVTAHRLRGHIIKSRYDSKLTALPRRRGQSTDPYEVIESLRGHGSNAMDKMYATVLSEFHLDSTLLPDDLNSVRHLGKHNIFNNND